MKRMCSLHLLCIALFAQACGGGDQQTVTSEGESPVVPAIPAPKTSDSDAENELSEMVIDAGYDLTLDFLLKVSVLLPHTDDQRYITICRYDPESDRVMRDECPFRGPLGSQEIQTTLTIANRDIELAAEIWWFVDGHIPNRYLWQYQTDSESQSFIVR